MSELAEEITNLKDGDHLCLFYHKDPVEQMPALIPFIQEALAKNEQFIYIADDLTVGELVSHLQVGGIPVGEYVDRGTLKLWTRREWRQPGKLSSEKKSRQVLDFMKAAADDGFAGVRFGVQMTWTLGPDIDPADLEHWEASINELFTPGSHRRIICQYNRSGLSPEPLLIALHTHPLTIWGNHVYLNWFYEAPLILNCPRATSERVSFLPRAFYQTYEANRSLPESTL